MTLNAEQKSGEGRYAAQLQSDISLALSENDGILGSSPDHRIGKAMLPPNFADSVHSFAERTSNVQSW